MTRIAVIPGDGIGVEVIAEALKVLRTIADLTGKKIDSETRQATIAKRLTEVLGGAADTPTQRPAPT